MLLFELPSLAPIFLALSASVHPVAVSAVPVTKHASATVAIESRAAVKSTGWFYDPFHSRDAQFKSQVIPESGKCNLLLSVIRKGEETNVYAFPACNLPPDGSRAAIETTITNATINDSGKYGELMLLEDIPQNNDRAKLVKGSNLSVLRQSKKVEHWSQGGGAGFLRGPWSKEAYTGDGKYTFNGKQGSLYGPYPNPYRLDIGQNAPKELPVDELILPLKEGSLKGSTAIFLYDNPA
ncbi:hypothetical protein NCC49_004508 [Naganishia albida]|nr:hypothetical protein NCC49_004508 [Naganishia albida]